MSRPPLLGLSRCLAGELVRYSGVIRAYPLVDEFLASGYRTLAICPEVEAGLPVPRPPARVEGSPLSRRFVEFATGRDHTFRVTTWAVDALERLARSGISGYVWKSGSPSCAGRTPVPLFSRDGRVLGRSFGLFAAMVAERFPGLPMTDEKALAFDDLREDFARKVNAYAAAGGTGCPA